MSTPRLPAKKAPTAPPAPAPAPAKAKALERTPEEKAERARVQAELERRQGIEAKLRRDQRIRQGVAALRQRWPDLFTTPVPLAVGVMRPVREWA